MGPLRNCNLYHHECLGVRGCLLSMKARAANGRIAYKARWAPFLNLAGPSSILFGDTMVPQIE